MNDKEKVAALLSELGIGSAGSEYDTEDETYIVCEVGDKKVTGYSGFSSAFKFDGNGKFIKMELGE